MRNPIFYIKYNILGHTMFYMKYTIYMKCNILYKIQYFIGSIFFDMKYNILYKICYFM